ncbi:MAG: hypothetical protein R3B36_12360 [Polyangiaceae bacterium]
MRSALAMFAVGAAMTACAIGAGRTGAEDDLPGPSAPSDGAGAMPWDPFDPGGDAGASSGSSGASSTGSTSSSSGASSTGSTSSSSGASSSGASSTGSTSSSSGASSTGSTSSSSGASSSGASSSGASSGASTSSSSGAAGGACGVCDRVWACNGFGDPWATQGARCVNQRTTTALRCDGYFDQGNSVKVGTWTSAPNRLTLRYPMLGGGTKVVECTP